MTGIISIRFINFCVKKASCRLRYTLQEVMDRPSYHVDHTPNHRFLVYFKTKGAPDGKTDPMGTKHPCDVQLFQKKIFWGGK